MASHSRDALKRYRMAINCGILQKLHSVSIQINMVNRDLRDEIIGTKIMRFPPFPVKRVIKYALFFSLIGANILIYSNA